jgi:hypothetical protein
MNKYQYSYQFYEKVFNIFKNKLLLYIVFKNNENNENNEND